MNQILRSCKFDIYLLSRCYGNQSKQCTHYDMLRISENSTQKEIREAFIKLSKEMHPDIKGNESHAEYVKINEAYNILSKTHLRRVYDSNIKYGHFSDTYSSYPSHPSYSSYSSYKTMPRSSEYGYYGRSTDYKTGQWNEYINSQNSDNYYNMRGMRSFEILFICISLTPIIIILLIMSMYRAMAFKREIAMLSSRQCQLEFKKAQLAAEGKSKKEQIQDFEAKIQAHENSKSVTDKN